MNVAYSIYWTNSKTGDNWYECYIDVDKALDFMNMLKSDNIMTNIRMESDDIKEDVLVEH